MVFYQWVTNIRNIKIYSILGFEILGENPGKLSWKEWYFQCHLSICSTPDNLLPFWCSIFLNRSCSLVVREKKSYIYINVNALKEVPIRYYTCMLFLPIPELPLELCHWLSLNLFQRCVLNLIYWVNKSPLKFSETKRWHFWRIRGIGHHSGIFLAKNSRTSNEVCVTTVAMPLP